MRYIIHIDHKQNQTQDENIDSQDSEDTSPWTKLILHVIDQIKSGNSVVNLINAYFVHHLNHQCITTLKTRMMLIKLQAAEPADELLLPCEQIKNLLKFSRIKNILYM